MRVFSKTICVILNAFAYFSLRSAEVIKQVPPALQGMYKGSEPIRLQHVLWMVRSRSEICPKFPKFPNLVRSSSIVFIEILLIFDNLSYFGVFLEKKT